MSSYSIVCVYLCLSVCWSLYKCHSQAHVGIPPSCPSFFLSFLFFFLYIPHDIHLQLLVSVYVCVYQKPHNKVILLYVTRKTAGVCVSRESQLVMMMVKKSCFFFFLFSFWWTTRKHDFTFCVCLPQTSPMFFQHKHRHTNTPPLHSTLFL